MVRGDPDTKSSSTLNLLSNIKVQIFRQLDLIRFACDMAALSENEVEDAPTVIALELVMLIMDHFSNNC